MESNGEIKSLRWNPTKRQKKILEQVFNAGERNPTRARVKQITQLLKVHGNVEEKNVFYWFQNSHSCNMRRQQKNSMHQQKEIAGSSQAAICSSPSNASSTILEPSIGFTRFSLQELANSPQSASSTATQTLPSNLLFKQHLHLAHNEAVYENTHAYKKQKQKKSKQDYPFNQKDIAESCKSSIYPSSINASNIIWEPAMGMGPFSPIIWEPAMGMGSFSPQRDDTNSPESVTKPLLPIILLARQHIQSAENESVCEVSFRNDMQHKVARSDGWLRRFTESTFNPRGSNIMIGSELEENQNKYELLQLFPLHPDANLRSQTMPQYRDGNLTNPHGSNVDMIGSEAKEDGNKHKHELLQLFPLHPDRNLN